MKRLMTILGILILTGAIAVPVLAYGPGWGRGPHMMGYWGGDSGGACWDSGRGAGNLSEEQRTALDKLSQKFYDETARLRNELLAKRAELNILLNTRNPDAEKARALQKEISDLKAKLDQEGINFEIEARKINPETRFGSWGYHPGFGPHMRGYGPGMGYGRNMGGYGPGNCWN
ncbi:MAG: periplasmic heavy metal sensor [Pseudomonadota bacterium]